MKKIMYLGIILFALCILITIPVYAADEPYYDKTYNNNAGAFYAKGTDITIEEIDSKTVVKWLGGSQEVPKSVTIFGGGQQDTSYSSSNITMNGGNIFCLVGGGISTQKDNSAIVENAKITVNGGNISGNVVGGGYLYSEVTDSAIEINGGEIESVIGGGFAELMIDGRTYYAGTADEPEKSGNRVEYVTIIINDVTIPVPDFPNGIVYGGGHSYSYVGETNIAINGGDLSKAYVTAGGTDGYTGKANVSITDGTIYLYQSVNKGIVGEVSTNITGGNIEKLFIGAESGVPPLTGKIEKCEIELMEGTIKYMSVGTNDSVPLVLDNEQYKLIQNEDVIIENSIIPDEQKILLFYNILINPKELQLAKGSSKIIESSVQITPKEYEYLFGNDINLESNDTDIATVSEEGIVTGINKGKTEIIASFLKKNQTVEVNVITDEIIAIVPLILVAVMSIIFIMIIVLF